ncbi:MAG: carbohydrate ABC transporter permease [Chloroflexi bacterium]|nr:carbohydrate ABC transporter permease [Chloroflexota bacterium]
MRAATRASLQYLVLIVVGLAVAFPLLLTLSASFMKGFELATYPPHLLPAAPQMDNYAQVIASIPVVLFVINSTVQSLLVTAGQLITSCLAAYAFAFVPFRGKQVVFALFMATLTIPYEAIIIPNFLTIRSLGWLNSFQGLAAPFLATAFGTFLLRQAFLQLPGDLNEAARIDGCSRLRFLCRIVVPLTRPALGTLAIYAFISTWNQFFWPLLVVNSDRMQTVQIGIARLWDAEVTNYNLIMAGIVLVLVPTILVVVLGQRQLVRGLTAGAVKG